MTWTKLSDDYSDDCWTLSDAAFRLHTEGLVWSNRKLLNLRISKDEVRRFAKHPDSVTELLGVGMWEEDGDDYLIVHHGAYQRDREAVINQQRANIENGKRGGRPAGTPREVKRSRAPKFEETQSLSESPTERDRTGQAGISEQVLETKESNSLSDSVTTQGGLNGMLSHCRVCRKQLDWPMTRSLALCDSTDMKHMNARAVAA
ncbi:MAG: hypothetical protein JWN70_4317 [Planctomycetaceae bacterium]|nr:hypothetical protein [Planctomycetaceae bacterium]